MEGVIRLRSFDESSGWRYYQCTHKTLHHYARIHSKQQVVGQSQEASRFGIEVRSSRHAFSGGQATVLHPDEKSQRHSRTTPRRSLKRGPRPTPASFPQQTRFAAGGPGPGPCRRSHLCFGLEPAVRHSFQAGDNQPSSVRGSRRSVKHTCTNQGFNSP